MSDLRLPLVDDEEESLEPTAAPLARQGIESRAVSSDGEALRELAGGMFDCAVVDVKIPGMDGLELLRRITRDYGGVPVILLATPRWSWG